MLDLPRTWEDRDAFQEPRPGYEGRATKRALDGAIIFCPRRTTDNVYEIVLLPLLWTASVMCRAQEDESL